MNRKKNTNVINEMKSATEKLKKILVIIIFSLSKVFLFPRKKERKENCKIK